MNGENDIRISISGDAGRFEAATRQAAAGQARLNQQVSRGALDLGNVSAEADKFIDGLRRTADTSGKTRGQIALYDAAQLGLKSTNLEVTRSLAQQIDAQERHERILGRVKTAAIGLGAALGTALVLGFRAMIRETQAAEQASARLDAVLQATGFAAGKTRPQLDALAESIKKTTRFDDDEIRNAMAQLLTFKNVQGDAFDSAIQVSLDLSEVMQTDLKSSVLRLGKALEDPVTQLTALRRSGVSFSDAQIDVIKKMVETGRQGEALTLILKTMKEKGLNGVAQALNTGLTKATGDLNKEWGDLLEAFGKTPATQTIVTGVLDAITASLRGVRGAVEDSTSALDLFLKTARNVPGPIGLLARGAQALVAEPRDPLTDARAIERRDRQELAAQERAQEGARRQRAAAEADRLATQAKKAAEEAKKFDTALAGVLDQALPLEAEAAKLAQQMEILDQAFARGKLSADQLAQGKANLRSQTASAKAALDALIQVEEESQAVAREAKQIDSDRINEGQKRFASLQQQIEQVEFETGLIGLNNAEREKAIALRELENDEVAKGLSNFDDLKQRLADALDSRAAREATQKATQDAQRAWEKSTDQINESLTDALFRGFESGKGFVENFTDTLENAFKSLILRPVIQAIVSPVGRAAAGLLGGLGIPGFAGAQGGPGGAGGDGVGGGGLSSLFSGGFSGFTNAGFQSVGVELGSQFIADIGNFGFGDPIVASLLNLATGNTRGAIGSLVLGGIGAAVGGPIGGTIGSALGSLVGGLFGNKKIPTRSTAGLSQTFDASGNVVGQSTNFAGATQFGQDTVGALFAQFNATAQALGAQFDAVNFSFGANTGKNSKNPQFRLGGGAGGSAFDSGSLRPSTGGETPLTEENLALASSRAILAALKGSELPQVLRGFFDSLVPEQLTQDAIDKALAFGSSLKQLSDQLDTSAAGLGDFAADFRAALSQVTGPEALSALQLFAQRVPAVTDALQGIVRGLPAALGIPGLQAFASSLAVSEVNAPLDRVAAARSQFESSLAAARGGDLAAVQAFPQVAQQLLTIGRDTFASGAGFQDLFREVNTALSDVLSRQQATQEDILRDVDITLRESAQDQIVEIRKQTTALTEELRAIRTELRRAAA